MVIRQRQLTRWLEGIRDEILIPGNEPQECMGWKYTPAEAIIPEVITDSFFENKTICVIINTEVVGHLRGRFPKMPLRRIFAMVENDERYQMALSLGVPKENIIRITKVGKKIMISENNNEANMTRKFDLVATNADFKILKEVRRFCKSISKKHFIFISDSAYYHSKTHLLEGVEDYYHMGDIFYQSGTAKVGAVMAIVNVDGTDTLTVHAGDSSKVEYDVKKQGLPKTAPGTDLAEWQWTENLLSKNFPGYDDWNKGIVSREGAKFDPKGTMLVFTAGQRGKKFDKSNFADEELMRKWNGKAGAEDKSKQKGMEFNTKFWTTADLTNDEALAGGFGKHKIVASHTSPDHSGLLPMKYLQPNAVCGMNCWWKECSSKKDAMEELQYFAEDKTTKLIRNIKSNVVTNSMSVWRLIPKKEFKLKWK